MKMNAIILCLWLTSVPGVLLMSCGSEPAEPPVEELTATWMALQDSVENKTEAFIECRKKLTARIYEEKSFGNMEHESLLAEMAIVEQKTLESRRLFQKWERGLQNIAQWSDGNRAFAHPEERTENKKYWKVDGHGSDLVDYLDEFAKWSQDFHKHNGITTKSRLASPSQEGVNWIDETFAGHTVVHNLVTLSRIRLDILNQCTAVLENFSASLSPEETLTHKMDSIYLDVKPVSERVKVGETFEVLITPMPKRHSVHPEFSGNGIVTVEPGGMSARQKVVALGGFGPGQNEKKQSYSMRVRVPTADGTYLELNHESTFTVLK